MEMSVLIESITQKAIHRQDEKGCWNVLKEGDKYYDYPELHYYAPKYNSTLWTLILLHQVCFSSRERERLLHRGIGKLTFPNMYNADFLELLWLLKREEIRSPKLDRALELLKKKQKPGGTWELEHQIKPLTVSITKTKGGNALVTRRAKEVLDFY